MGESPLALIAVGHVRVFTDFPRLWAALGINADQMSAVSGGIAGIVIMIFAILLLLRRAVILRVREVTNFSDIIALLLVVSILVTGNWMRFGEHFDLANEANLARRIGQYQLVILAGQTHLPDETISVLRKFCKNTYTTNITSNIHW